MEEVKIFKGMMAGSREHERQENYDIMAEHGYFRPTPKERKEIKKAFETINITIYGNGFDLINRATKKYLDKGTLTKHIKNVTLYELKSTWRTNVTDKFKGFSFGITSNELKNNTQLGNHFKIIFLNGNTKKIHTQSFKSIGKFYANTCHFFTVGKKNKAADLENLIR
jgi:hypothetical protein